MAKRTATIIGVVMVALLIGLGVLWYRTSRPAPVLPQNADNKYEYMLQLISKGEKGRGYTAQEFQILKQYALYENNEVYRQLAIAGFFFVKDRSQKAEALQILHSITQNPGHILVLDAAIQAIGILGSRSDGERIARFLSHPDAEIRKITVRALAHIGDPAFRARLEPLAQSDPDEKVRAAVKEALRKWKPSQPQSGR